MTDKKPVKKTRKPAAKKTPVKKASTKTKIPVKKAEPKKPELTDREKTIVKLCDDMLAKGYTVQVKCKGRAKVVKSSEDCLSYTRANEARELVGMKSGAHALCYRIG